MAPSTPRDRKSSYHEYKLLMYHQRKIKHNVSSAQVAVVASNQNKASAVVTRVTSNQKITFHIVVGAHCSISRSLHHLLPPLLALNQAIHPVCVPSVGGGGALEVEAPYCLGAENGLEE